MNLVFSDLPDSELYYMLVVKNVSYMFVDSELYTCQWKRSLRCWNILFTFIKEIHDSELYYVLMEKNGRIENYMFWKITSLICIILFTC